MRRIGFIAIVLAWLAPPAPAAALDWPTRPVRIIVPVGPGGGTDVFARLLGEELYKRLGQPFVVENRPGGSFNIGARACAESTPDGYTLCITPGEPIVWNQFLFKNLPFKPETDFAPIANLFFNTAALVANSSLNVRTIPDLIALAKARPGTLSYATFSMPLMHFMEKLKARHGIDIVRVPFRSGNEAVNALVSGSTPIALLGLANMLPQLRGGMITGIALNANVRSPLFPGLPTLTEAVGEDYPPGWFGLFAPGGTPKPIIAKVAAEVARITSEPGFRQRNYIDRAIEPAVTTPEDFAGLIAGWRKMAETLVREAGVQPQ